MKSLSRIRRNGPSMSQLFAEPLDSSTPCSKAPQGSGLSGQQKIQEAPDEEEVLARQSSQLHKSFASSFLSLSALM